MIKIITAIFALFTACSFSLAASEKTLDPQAIISGYQYQHPSRLFGENRRYMVSLPERYHMNNRHYASLYVVDADFQFQHVSAVVKNLARMGKLPPMIVVGIANQGSDDYLKSTTWPDPEDKAFGGAETFQAYLKQELLPLIDSRYRTNHQKALSGYSLGGLFTLYSMMQPDTPFNAFLAMSPSAWFDKNSLPGKLEPLLKQGKLTAPVFISLASEEGMGVDNLVEVFEQSAPATLNWQYRHYPNENHFTTALPALYDGLQFLAPEYAVDGSDMLALGDYKQVLAHFKAQQKNWAGFQFEWLHAYQFSKYMFWSKQLDLVDDALQLIEKEFPESLTGVTIQLANGFNKRKNFKRVAQLLAQVKTDGEILPGWHKQMSVYYQGVNKPELARQHQQQALKLARQYQLESWEVWELK
ncbi:alpha/beta hydrolase [Thalassomonas viridans]|uniref:Alpha/beta hydrolase n=1 Tax=Thalassomonas viridans TaxID=137584 RepID=A0AAF0C9G4_9GAMM|nr:alpha/beta hydrolase-fold protein [Thalassomonas viridans]WDE05446.1 alpha/beta hydrolase [Thalassomonas viridans]